MKLLSRWIPQSLSILTSAVLLVGCSSAAPAPAAKRLDSEQGARSASLFKKDTAVCVSNVSTEAVKLDFDPVNPKASDKSPHEFWYPDFLGNGPKQSGPLTLQPNEKVCTTEADSEYSFNQYNVRIFFYPPTGTAYFGLRNSVFSTPDIVVQDKWAYEAEERTIHKCQVMEYDFKITRQMNRTDQINWSVEFLGPADLDVWPNKICTQL